jgi:hypothetical protein
MLRKILLCLYFLVISTLSSAQVYNPPLGVQDESGAIERPVLNIKCVGAGVSCDLVGNNAVLTIPGGGGSLPASNGF